MRNGCTRCVLRGLTIAAMDDDVEGLGDCGGVDGRELISRELRQGRFRKDIAVTMNLSKDEKVVGFERLTQLDRPIPEPHS